MSKKTNRALKSALRGLGRAFKAQDAAAFDEALEELEEAVTDEGEEEPDTIEVHNHMPADHYMRDTSLGELPPKDPARDGEGEEEMPKWAKDMCASMEDRFKKVGDAVEGLKKWAEEEGREPEHSEDRHRDSEEEMGDHADPSLEMSDRRRNNDEPSEREEMAERIKENERGKDRRDHRRHDDEANREILGELEFEAPPGTGDRARKARDSRYLEDSFQDVLSKAESIAPGIALPAFDAAASPIRTFRAIDKLRRTTLDLAYNKAETRGVIEGALSGRTFDAKRASFGNTRVLFNVVAGAAATSNNQRATDGRPVNNGHRQTAAGIQSVADINKRNAEFYKRA